MKQGKEIQISRGGQVNCSYSSVDTAALGWGCGGGMHQVSSPCTEAVGGGKISSAFKKVQLRWVGEHGGGTTFGIALEM